MTVFDGFPTDGRTIAANMHTFYRMYRADSTIRRCVDEIQQTSGKCGWELRQYSASGEKSKVVKDEQIDQAIKNS